MPIRLNLLAEAQAAEEMRRKDPVKRASWLAGIFIAAMLAVSSYLQLCATVANSTLSHVQGQINAQTNSYKTVVEAQKKIAENDFKLNSLRLLSANRLLYGTLLNSFQKTTVEDVQLLHLKVDQIYSATEAGKSKTNDDNVVIKGKPATATERILVTVEGMDSSANPGDQVNKFKELLATCAYSKEHLAKTNAVSLKNLSALQVSPTTGKSCEMFALECRYPEKTR